MVSRLSSSIELSFPVTVWLDAMLVP